MRQITNNPEMMQNMLSAPYTQSMMQAMQQNPDMAANIVGSNPLFAGNPQMQVRDRRSRRRRRGTISLSSIDIHSP